MTLLQVCVTGKHIAKSGNHKCRSWIGDKRSSIMQG